MAKTLQRAVLMEVQRNLGNRAVQRLLAGPAGPNAAPIRRMIPAGPAAETLGVEGLENVQIAYRAGVNLLQFVGRPIYIPADQITLVPGLLGFGRRLRVNDAELLAAIQRYLGAGLVLYRGVTRWHPTWFDALAGRVLPLGGGALPDFDTRNTAFTPWTPVRQVAIGPAMQIQGMGPGDQLRFVHNYSRTPNFAVGVILRVTARPPLPIGFMNSSEIQVRAPIDAEIDELLQGSTAFSQLGIAGAGALHQLLPAEPSPAEQQQYRLIHGGRLRHEP